MVKITRSSGNVFEDLNLKDASELKAKSILARQISMVISSRKLKQKEAERLTGIDQGDISKIVNGNCDRFTIDRLLSMLLKLGQDIDINIHPAKHDVGHISCIAA